MTIFLLWCTLRNVHPYNYSMLFIEPINMLYERYVQRLWIDTELDYNTATT